ncbi:hypothetical protein MK163_16205, partial [bacterium]|nr:hypothetical protein [bacterium]
AWWPAAGGRRHIADGDGGIAGNPGDTAARAREHHRRGAHPPAAAAGPAVLPRHQVAGGGGRAGRGWR